MNTASNPNLASSKHVLQNPTIESVTMARKGSDTTKMYGIQGKPMTKQHSQAKNSNGASKALSHQMRGDCPNPMEGHDSEKARQSCLESGSRQSKYAAQKTASNIFGDSPTKSSAKGSERGQRHLNSKASMGGILAHDEGPKTRIGLPNNKKDVAQKINDGSIQQTNKNTFAQTQYDRENVDRAAARHKNVYESNVF